MAKRDPNLIQSLERGLAALEMVVRGSVRPTDLAARLNIDRSTAYRLLYTLMVNGYLNQDPTRRDFVPNPSKFFALSSEVAGPMNWPVIAAGFLRVLRDRTGETANLGVQEGHEIVYIGQQPTHEALAVRLPLGTRRSLHGSALGKAILAFLPDTEIDRLIPESGLPAHTPNTITEPQRLKLHLQTVRRQGYAIDDEETFEGGRCLAAPIYDHRDQIIASMGISGPSTRLTLNKLPELASIVVDVASQTSEALGAQASRPGDGVIQVANTTSMG
jgi:DNA-binding IclR family transcriptional regulator